MRAFFEQIFGAILDWVFPARYNIRHIEGMRPADFAGAAARVVDDLPAGITSLFKYRDPLVRKALWALKYDGNKHVARLFAALIADGLLETLSDAELFDNALCPIIIPVPLSRERLRERGWNQSELIVQELIKLCPQCEYGKNILFKTRHTPPQTKLHRNARLENLHGCFSVPDNARHLVAGRFVILIDDVTTTGATLWEARRTLKAAGTKNIIAFTIAH